MKLAIIGIVGLPANYGGFETLVENLVESESFISFEQVTVYCSSKAYSTKVSKHSVANTKLEYIPFRANGGWSVLYDISSILHAIFTGHRTLLLLGVSGALILPLINPFYSGKIVINVDGIESRRKKWGYFAGHLLKFFEKISCKYADVVISDNEMISKYLYEEYERESITIAYGGDHLKNKNGSISLTDRSPSIELPENYSYSLCRIEPENNVELILEAFKNLKVPLVFIGNWQNSEYGRELHDAFSDYDHITLLDPIYDVQLINKVRDKASYYIHGHSAGGTNPSLVEAIFYDAKIIAFDCDFNRSTLSDTGQYFSEPSDIGKLMSYDEPGTTSHVKLRKQYTWTKISDQYFEVLVR